MNKINNMIRNPAESASYNAVDNRTWNAVYITVSNFAYITAWIVTKNVTYNAINQVMENE